MKLELQGMAASYGTGRQLLIAVDGIDLALPRGRTVGLVGESGCGKSTVARAIVGLVPIVRGSLLLDGRNHTDSRSRNTTYFRRRVQMIFQDPYSTLNPRMTVSETITEALSLRIEGQGSDLRTQAVKLLDRVGLPSNVLDRYPHQFSGGQQQRIAIARALAVGPEVIISDEATSSLDVSVQATILNLLRDLQNELSLSYIFISHDLSIARIMSDAVAVMYLGRIVEQAPTEELFNNPRHPYTRALIASVPQVGASRRQAPLTGELPDPRNPPVGCRFHTRCPIGPLAHPEHSICMEVDPQAIADKQKHAAACHFATDQTPLELSTV